MYGPTETTIWSMTQPIASLDGGISIGTPIANTQVYVLDKFRRPVPTGMPGELHIGGDGVARGYLNRPELTADRFVRNPFSDRPDARMYATGDLASFRPDGTMDFIGRADFQVKVRGYRIELGEIESVIEAQPGILEAAVIVKADDAADQRLVAFMVPRDGVAAQTAELRSALRAKLPEYMIPNEFVTLLEMPRTANGKLDRKALQAIRPEPVRQVTADALPQSETEKLIVDSWRKTLKLEHVGVNDNFFDLGGHSLLVVQLHNELKQRFSSPLSLTDLYQYPTVRSLSEYIASGSGGEALQKSASRGARRRALRKRSA
jgi:long-subunit acyl-CoA synthetase (AMP-forming)